MSNRNFVSESTIPQIIKNLNSMDIFNKKYIESEIISNEKFKLFLEKYKNNISFYAKKLVKNSRSRLEYSINKKCYIYLENKNWFLSALIAELFRDPFLSKNFNDISFNKLQEKIFYSLKNNKIKLVIGWGQAKRSCGNLKTNGYGVDFSEFYSLSVLQIIIESIKLISNKKVNVVVLTGGDRFSSALFVNQKENNKYDNQRKIIADMLSIDGISKIILIPYGENNVPLDDLNLFINNIPEIDVMDNIKTILLNIDWINILSNNISPHNICIPDGIRYLLNNGWSINDIILMSITSILDESNSEFWIKRVGNKVIFNEVVDFFYLVSIFSTKIYLSIHLMNKIEKVMSRTNLSDAIRLTVHTKKDRNDIPSIYLLGRDGGNRLSQHTCAVFYDKKLHFLTKLEMLLLNKEFKEVYVHDSLFKEGFKSDQPFIYVDKESESYLEDISKYRFFY
ncbi:hypothetical protein [Gallibacterium anatis]|uniref:hypothetical protein n=1 Tax=Gallibacterium anatis TaxID=750 RepID=UPI000531EC32|nr:hypothetical protein [Gallibacterium anatis]KGQ68154.1 hypothetical protein IO47_06260 [Gallibacterium anatis]